MNSVLFLFDLENRSLEDQRFSNIAKSKILQDWKIRFNHSLIQ